MKPFLVKYKSRLINVDFIDTAGERYWGHEVYPEIGPKRKWVDIDFCEKICYDQGEGKK